MKSRPNGLEKKLKELEVGKNWDHKIIVKIG